jgi:hypothetical protein
MQLMPLIKEKVAAELAGDDSRLEDATRALEAALDSEVSRWFAKHRISRQKWSPGAALTQQG